MHNAINSGNILIVMGFVCDADGVGLLHAALATSSSLWELEAKKRGEELKTCAREQSRIDAHCVDDDKIVPLLLLLHHAPFVLSALLLVSSH